MTKNQYAKLIGQVAEKAILFSDFKSDFDERIKLLDTEITKSDKLFDSYEARFSQILESGSDNNIKSFIKQIEQNKKKLLSYLNSSCVKTQKSLIKYRDFFENKVIALLNDPENTVALPDDHKQLISKSSDYLKDLIKIEQQLSDISSKILVMTTNFDDLIHRLQPYTVKDNLDKTCDMLIKAHKNMQFLNQFITMRPQTREIEESIDSLQDALEKLKFKP